MKRIISLALVLLLCLSMLVACGEDGKKDESKKDEGSTAPTTTATPDNEPAQEKAADAAVWLAAQYQTGNPEEPMVIREDKEVLTKYKSFGIAWSVAVSEGAEDSVKIAESDKEGYVLIDVADSVSAAVIFTVTATISNEDGSDTADVTFLYTIPGPVEAPAANSEISIELAIELGLSQASNTYTDEKYYIVATVVSILDAGYGNMTVKDDKGNNFTIRGSYGPDGNSISFSQLDPQPKEGDTVKLYGPLGQYEGTAQMKNAWIKEINGKKPGKVERPTVKEPAANSEVSIEDAIALGLSKDHNVYTSNKYYVTGEITEIYDENYGNMYIKDSKGNILTVYGTYGADGAQKFSELTNKPKKGDTVTIYGRIGQFGEKPQIKNGWITKINGKDQIGTAGELPTAVATPEVGKAYKFGMIQENVTASAIYYLVGGMNGYYMATGTDASKAIDVYLEEAEGGYYLYTLSGSKKQYINMVVSGTHVNGAYENTAKTVYTYDATAKTLIAEVNGADYWFATRNDKEYTTMGPCKIDYEGFYGMFYEA